jgi:hypothetical protein
MKKEGIAKTRILPTDDVQEWGTCVVCGLAARRRAGGRLRKHGPCYGGGTTPREGRGTAHIKEGGATPVLGGLPGLGKKR